MTNSCTHFRRPHILHGLAVMADEWKCKWHCRSFKYSRHRRRALEGHLGSNILNPHLLVLSIMPGTHLLPPNLLKLFAPRPPLPYSRPVDRDIDRITKKDVAGVGPILTQLKEATTEGLITAGETDAMEEGEEPAYTHAEEVKRQIRREERKKKRTEEFKVAKEACESILVLA